MYVNSTQEVADDAYQRSDEVDETEDHAEAFCARTFVRETQKMTKEEYDAAVANLSADERQSYLSEIDKLEEKRDYYDNAVALLERRSWHCTTTSRTTTWNARYC